MYKEVPTCEMYNNGQCAMSGTCKLQDCDCKHTVKWFFIRLFHAFNIVNKYYAVKLSWICYQRDIISFKEFLYSSWYEIWRF